MTMNIAFFSKQLPSDRPNGVSVQVDRLAGALVDRGHAVTCFSFSPRPEAARYNHVPLSWGVASRAWKKFVPALEFSKINKQSFDICHFHGDDYLCRGPMNRVRTFYGSALFEALHATARPGRFLYQVLFYTLEWLSFFRGGAFVAISSSTRRALPLVGYVVPCGVPLDRYAPPPVSMKSAHPSLLFIGDFNSRKQGGVLLSAFVNNVLPRFPKATLTVVGPESVTADHVRCLGRVAERDLINEYRKAWVYCLPSSYEGFGVPAIEAMACGTAVVAVANAGTRELIKNGVDGVLCNRSGLGDAINNVLENAELRDMLVRNGLDKAKDYDMRDIAGRYEAIYEKTMAAGR
jgi:glycosyltransferase involved in cell wall biosynthesis